MKINTLTRRFILSLVLLLSVFSLVACAQTTKTSTTKSSQSSSSAKKSTYPEVTNLTVNKILRAYPTLSSFDKIFLNPKVNAYPMSDINNQKWLKIDNNGQKGGLIGVPKGATATTVVTTDSKGKPIYANDPRIATIAQIRAALKARDEGKLK